MTYFSKHAESGCDGCPLSTENYDDDGNMIYPVNEVDEAAQGEGRNTIMVSDMVFLEFTVGSHVWIVAPVDKEQAR